MALHTENADAECLPAPLQRLASDPRVMVRRDGSPKADGACVVYWMQRSERGMNNAAVDCAASVANELGLPLLVYFSAISDFPHANLRHYVFLNQGLPDIEADLAERNIAFIVRRPPGNSLEKLLDEVNAAILIGDENPCREPEHWRQVIARRIRIPFWTVDADVVVPSNVFGKAQYAAHVLRPRLHRELPSYLHALQNPRVQHGWKLPKNFDSYPVTSDITAGWKKLDRSVKPVESFTGGSRAARKRLEYFVRHVLPTYDQNRNQPTVDGSSRLSPYLHFGHISSMEIVLAVNAAVSKNPSLAKACDAFCDEILVWRELAINFVKYTPTYDSVDCADPWAARSLAEHAHDRREWDYTRDQLERGETHDELWNASQLQMVNYGWMHNYLRMYWAKKILEWSASPAIALEHAIFLNDRYELDGRDPGGYAGIAWAIVGKFDRPWFDRPIFGKVRYMSGGSTGKKFDSQGYIRLVRANAESGKLW
ncbi:MAG TPA: deoxyribodipyrimidine photo-lyase [Acidobacteriaceae bacterium]|nr:deoxyribodipyrimidine photo-lyase [Acidobacteriaceae bacterium]